MAAHSDAELIGRVREHGLGWKLAFNVLLGRHREWLLKHCAFRLGNQHDAQDVAQQVILRAWRAIDRFEGRSAFRTWLYTIAENQCRSFAVKRMRYVQTEHIESLIDLYLEGASASVAERYARNQAVAVALENVNDKAREVLLLRFFQGVLPGGNRGNAGDQSQCRENASVPIPGTVPGRVSAGGRDSH